jgi:hypothetical protein
LNLIQGKRKFFHAICLLRKFWGISVFCFCFNLVFFFGLL